MKLLVNTVIASFALGCSLLALGISQPVAAQLPTQGEHFTVCYGAPLGFGLGIGSGIDYSLDSSRILSANVGELRPALSKAVEAAVDGKLPTYSDNDAANAKGADPLKRMPELILSLAETKDFNIKAADLLIEFRIVYEGVAASGKSTLTPQYIDLLWFNPNDLMPNIVVARLLVKDLARYKVKTANGSVTLPAYLTAGNYERLVLEVKSDRGMKQIASYEESKDLQDLILKGDIHAIIP